MKLSVLTSVGHNISDSLASGVGLMIGVYEIDIFGEASRAAEGFIEVDFLTGEIVGGEPSKSLARAVALYAKALPDLCERHGIPYSSIRRLTTRFSGRGPFGGFVVTVEDDQGRRSTDDYGSAGDRLRVLDHLGRLRPKRKIAIH